ncbi:MAG TPA: FtsX-like permease family protein, partial [Candidatus Dormibacteraeota bacterium]|nr:FtsX-like permease family protein [Candidatus Dormibacteraeota bacterium]
DPLGRQFFPDDGYPSGCRIVGVSGQVKIQGPAEASRFEFYIPYTVVAPASVVYGLRTDVDPMGLAPIVRQIMQKIDGDIPLVNTRTIEEIASDSVARPRFRAGLIGAFASLALLLAVIGTYGVLAYAVTQRTREFGIRMALGARAPDILRLVLGDGLQMTLLGIAVGLAAATGLTRYLSSMLFGVRPLDPVTFATVPLLLALAALAACYVPGRRAVCVDPLAALRYE